jgi:hypothetical protein
MAMPSVQKSTSRAAFLTSTIAFKFALHQHGAKCNLFEAKLYRDADARRKAMLCPVLWCSPNGAVLIARRAAPLIKAQWQKLLSTDGFPDWDYDPADGMGGNPFEHHKACDWGLVDGRLVAVDFSATVLSDEDELRMDEHLADM